MAAVDFGEYRASGRISERRMRASGREGVRRFGVKVSDEEALLSTLSGGNQQKTVVGRWLSRSPRLLLLDEPTHCVDVGARADIYRLIHDAVDSGAAAIIVASDFEELAHVVHRAVVLREGRVVAEVSGDDLTPRRLLQLTSEGTTGGS
jgi:ribose transport system ATP-binding protein